MAGWLALVEISQIAFYLPEGDFDTQGQEEGQNNGGNVFSSKGGTFG